MHLTLPLPPSANTYWRHSSHGIYLSKQALEYRAAVAQICSELTMQILDGGIVLRADFYICDDRRDLGNCEKQLSDALQGWAFEDDNQLVEIHLRRFKVQKRKEAKVEVILTSID